MIAYAVLAALAGGAIALAYGYRGQRDQEREQVVYLRGQLREARGLPPAKSQQRDEQEPSKSTAVATFGGSR
jgi:hypothetical protein